MGLSLKKYLNLNSNEHKINSHTIDCLHMSSHTQKASGIHDVVAKFN